MKLDKLFGSKAKADILKYLVFRRQGISVRAFESELEWSFPAIKKQIDQLEDAGVIEITKNNSKWSIYLTKGLGLHIKNLMLIMLRFDLEAYFKEHDTMIKQKFWGKLFGKNLDMDLVIVYNDPAKDYLDTIKTDIEEIFRGYLIEYVTVWFMSGSDFDKRYRLADKFVVNLMRSEKDK